MSVYGDLVVQLLFPALAVFLVAAGITAGVVGVGLIVASPRMFRLFAVLNRYVSTRHALRSAAIPRQFDRFVHGNRRVFGALIVAGSAFGAVGLLRRAGDAEAVFGFGMDYATLLAIWLLVELLRLLMIAGCLAGIVVGVLLLFFPAVLQRLESRLNRWVSVRRMAGDVDKMHLALDRLVEARPRTAGWAVTAGGLAIVACGLVLLAALR